MAQDSGGTVTERQWFTIGMFGLTAGMLLMTYDNPGLWDVKLFEVILQAIVITGLLNMAGAFHFAATKSDEQRTINTGKALDAIKAAQESAPVHNGEIAGVAAQETADAAQAQANEIKGG
jgi:hypothetical protein